MTHPTQRSYDSIIHRISAACTLGLLFILTVHPAQAAPVIVLRLAEDPLNDTREEQFALELTLLLDDFTVREEHIEAAFLRLSLAEQIDRIRPLVASGQDQRPAGAVTWLDPSDDGQLALHLVTVDADQALVRLVESRASGSPEAELALVARELLAETWFFATPMPADAIPPILPSPPPAAPQEAVPEPTHRARWFVTTAASLTVSLHGEGAPEWHPGAHISVDRRLFNALLARIRVGIHPVALHEPSLGGAEFLGGFGVVFLPQVGPIGLGGTVIVDVVTRWTRFDPPAHSEQTIHTVPQFSIEAVLRVPAHATWQLDVGLGVAASPLAQEYRRTSDNALLSASSHWNGRLGLGLVRGF